jgi:outer membrane protein assembly factor BamB
MIERRPGISLGLRACALSLLLLAPVSAQKSAGTWLQWRGPGRDGQVGGPAWPASLKSEHLRQAWRAPLLPSYSSPIVSGDRVFTTETRDKSSEVVTAWDRHTGKLLWTSQWKGAIEVPFFAAANGSWIRSTPAYDGENLYVAGMRDVLVCLSGKTGKEQWRVDFTERYKTAPPDFGLVSSPLVDRGAVYIQASNAVVKLDKATGNTLWRSFESPGGIGSSGSFSSPVLRNIAGTQQLIVQSRTKLAGLDPANGHVLWQQAVASFQGMNILTPTVFEDGVFTSTYGGRSSLIGLSVAGGKWTTSQRWDTSQQGYMCSPVVVDGHAYLHLRSNRLTCIDLTTGKECWTSARSFGNYMSMVAQKDRVLALDTRGSLYLIRANPKQFELLDERKVADSETWAHLAVAGNDIFIRELNALAAWRWK